MLSQRKTHVDWMLYKLHYIKALCGSVDLIDLVIKLINPKIGNESLTKIKKRFL